MNDTLVIQFYGCEAVLRKADGAFVRRFTALFSEKKDAKTVAKG